MAKIAPYSRPDFFEARNELVEFLKNQQRFKDYDFEGSNLSVLVDLLAYNSYNTLQYYNMSISEMFLDSAQLKNSVVSHAKELNYVPRSRRSSRGIMNIQVRSNQASNTYILPRFATFQGRCGNITYDFITTKAFSGSRTSGNIFELENVEVFEGRIFDEILSHTNTTINNTFIDTSSLQVFVNGIEYRYATTIFGVQEQDRVFYIQPEINGKYSIQFGENIFGYSPTESDEIRVRYRITSGVDANGVNSYSIDASQYGALSMVTTPVGCSAGGTDVETTESIRKFAPRAFQVQERAITSKDYEVLLRQRFPQIESISVFGGEEDDPPQFGRVIIVVDVKGRDGASLTELELFKEYISDKGPISIEPIFRSADFVYSSLTVDVKFNKNDILLSNEQLEDIIRGDITSYSNDNLNDFKVGLITSALQAKLLESDASVESISIVANPIIEWSPPIGVINSPSFNFGSELIKPYPYTDVNGLTDFKPAFTTSQFTLEGTPVTLQDNGSGGIVAIVANTNDRSIFKKDLGSVDYNRGVISFKDITVQGFDGSSISVIASTVDTDVVGTKDRIVRIRQQDVTVNVKASVSTDRNSSSSGATGTVVTSSLGTTTNSGIAGTTSTTTTTSSSSSTGGNTSGSNSGGGGSGY